MSTYIFHWPLSSGEEVCRYDDHVAALAEATVSAGVWRAIANVLGEEAKPRTLTADDPEPAVGSVVLDRDGSAWQSGGEFWHEARSWSRWTWRELRVNLAPLRLIHDGGQACECGGVGSGCHCEKEAGL